MKKISLIFALPIISFAVFTACQSSTKTEKVNPAIRVEQDKHAHSYANFHQIATKHLHLELDVDFSNNIIYGIAQHTMENNSADTAIFDIQNLNIEKVTVGKEKIPVNFVIGKSDSILGAPLYVAIQPEDTLINIHYSTSPGATALDWLPAELTSGKKHPYMYSQGQAILTRSWIPLQDSPSNRITYSAHVKVPKDLLPIMSATNPAQKNASGEYHFEMQQAIPPYLIAIAVGDMQYHAFSENTGVYSEPELIDACAKEFIDLPKMMQAAEELYGKYQWEQYDIVVLPYSFPFGGMENPRLTFANPTLIAGDKSLVSVIAHELAHSWSGNLVTNASWDDFWLNEGFTVYFENRIMEELYGKEVANMLAVIEYQELQNTLERLSDKPEDTKLKLNLSNRNPDDGMTDIAYVKGAFFLRTLENEVGRENFDAFLKEYFAAHAFQTITTEDFIRYLENELLVPQNSNFNVDEWVYEAGLPQNCIAVHSKRLKKIEQLAADFATGKDIFSENTVERSDFTTQEWQAFIRKFNGKLSPNKMWKIDEKLNLSSCGNAEIMTEWYVLGIKNGYTAIRNDMEKFLLKVGRRKFLEPIYETLARSNSENLKWAKSVFEKAKNNYHFVSRQTIEGILEK